MNKTVRNEKGVALVFTIMVFAVLMIFITFLAGFMVNENKMSIVHKRKIQAYYLARSGAVSVEKAILEMDDATIENLDILLTQAKDEGIDVDYIDFDGTNSKVKLIKKNEVLYIKSQREVEGVTETVTKVLEENPKSTYEISNLTDDDLAIYIEESVTLPSGFAPEGGGKLLVSNEAEVNTLGTDKVTRVIKNFPTLDIKKMQALKEGIATKDDRTKGIGQINKSTVFTSKAKIVFDNSTKIYVNSGPLDIVVSKLEIDGKGAFSITGGNKVRIFVEDEITFTKNTDHINKNGDSNQLEIYYYGFKPLNITADINSEIDITANFFVEKADIMINKIVTGMLYAPMSKIKITNKSTQASRIYGIIANELAVMGNKTPKISKPKEGAEIPLDLIQDQGNGSGGDDGKYKKGYFQ